MTEFFQKNKPLAGLKALVTSGPTHEPIDPVRFIGNRSSGKQGHAIAHALSQAGASVTLVSGPVALDDPEGIKTTKVETAQEMLKACESALPADIAICAAAVSDWRADKIVTQKIKKNGGKPPALQMIENPDILKTIAGHKQRPQLVIGFAAETENLIENARKKLKAKNCDWILANDVAKNDTFGNDQNTVMLLTASSDKEFPMSDKEIIARDIVQEIIHYFDEIKTAEAAE